uniref:Uncharacterized protein n=1 Tax=Arundo donax TaxID=35708 RepID=A0A0A8YAV3_ARUDO
MSYLEVLLKPFSLSFCFRVCFYGTFFSCIHIVRHGLSFLFQK